MKSFRLQIVTPSGTVFDDEVSAFSARGLEGDFAVLAGHVPFVTYVREGRCSLIDPSGNKKEASVSGGLLTVGTDGVRFLPTSFSFEGTGP